MKESTKLDPPGQPQSIFMKPENKVITKSLEKVSSRHDNQKEAYLFELC